MRGSVKPFTTKDGERHWQARIYGGFDPVTRKERRLKKNFAEKGAADKWVRSMIGGVERGETVTPSKMLVAEFIAMWEKKRPASVSEQTMETNYTPTFRTHFVPAFGHVQLRHLTPAVIAGYLKSRADMGLSPTSQHHHLMLLHRLLSSVVAWGLLASNPADRVPREDRPHRNSSKVNLPWGDEEVRLFLATARRVSSHPELWSFLVYTGCRLGEALAAKWSNLRGNTLRITETYDRRLPADIRFHKTKTEAGTREIALPPILVDELDRVQRQQAEWKALHSAAYNDCDLIFATRKGRPLHPDHLRGRDFAGILKAAGLPRIRPHDLRHLHATLLLDAGESALVVQQRLGHRDSRTTLDIYGHVMKGAQERAAARFEERLKGRIE